MHQLGGGQEIRKAWLGLPRGTSLTLGAHQASEIVLTTTDIVHGLKIQLAVVLYGSSSFKHVR